jgi:ferritin-like metal-binding protein YciE
VVPDVRELFIHRLHQMLWVEQRLADEILPLFYDHVHAADLKYGLERHLLETRQHVTTVRTVLNLLGERQDGIESPALLGLKAEHDSLMEDYPTDLMHCDVIAANEHLEIAAYTWLRSTANALGEEDIAMRLTEILEQEEYALELVHKATVKILAETVTAA